MQHVSFDALSDSVQDFLARVWEAEEAIVEDEQGRPYYRVVCCENPAGEANGATRLPGRRRRSPREMKTERMQQAG